MIEVEVDDRANKSDELLVKDGQDDLRVFGSDESAYSESSSSEEEAGAKRQQKKLVNTRVKASARQLTLSRTQIRVKLVIPQKACA
jgi:hypothetical protein